MTRNSGVVLVADDEDSIRLVLAQAMREAGYQAEQVDCGEAALARLRAGGIDVALIDIKMPDLDGLTLLSRLREAQVETPVIVITAQNTMNNAIEAMRRGAFEYITKPFDLEEVQMLVERALEMRRQSRDLHRLEQESRRRFELGVEIIGKTSAMQGIFKTIGRVAHTDATVLIQGESGTGKELIGRAVHSHSQRWAGPFIALNCSAVPRDLLESELFGHEKGAFTGAIDQRPGVFEVANGGTLLLDEVGDMPLELQAKLLRVIQEKELTRIGGREVIKTDCRIVAATHRDLEAMVKQGRFREDLYFRLKVVPVTVPSLRERKGDIPELVDYFLDKINREMGTGIVGLARETLELLVQHDWPGNVRELENTLIRAAVLAAGSTLMPTDLALARREPAAPPAGDLQLEDLIRLKLGEYFRDAAIDPRDLYEKIIERVERPLIELTLDRTNGNQLRAAAILGINRNTLHKKITYLRIEAKRAPMLEEA